MLKAYFDFVLAILFIIAAIYQYKKQVVFMVDYSKYTEKSIKKFVKPMVAMTLWLTLVFGIMFIGEVGIVKGTAATYCDIIALIMMLLDVAAYLLATNTILVKKTKPMGYKLNNKNINKANKNRKKR